MDNRYIINLFALEKSLVYYLNSINSNGVLIEKLKNYSTRINFKQDESEFLDDMLIENTQCYKQAEIYSNILASLMDARASVVGNNLNVLMKTLTIITIGIMVPTFVVSAFSMNVAIPLENHPYAFYIVIGLALSSILVLRWWLKKKQW
jgi:magnesium transporter